VPSKPVAPSLGLEVRPINLRNIGEIERTIAAFALSPNGGLIVTGSALSVVHRKLLIGLAAQHKSSRRASVVHAGEWFKKVWRIRWHTQRTDRVSTVSISMHQSGLNVSV
jgi:hypothetical protein